MGNRKTAVEFYNAAVTATNDKSNQTNLTTAYQLFVSSVYADPSWWQSHYQCSNNVADMNFHAAAVAGYRRALYCEMTPEDKAKVCANLCDRLRMIGRAEESATYGLLATGLDPKNQAGWLNLSVTYQILRKPHESVQAAEKAYALDPDNVAAQIGLAFALLFDGQYSQGFDMFESRYRYALHSFTQYPYPKWRGEPDCTLMLVADQGMGDVISFARFIPEVLRRVKFAHVAVHRELMRTFQQAFLRYDNIEIVPLQPNFRQADYYTSFVSLPWSLKLTQEEIVDTPQITLPSSGVASMHGQSWKVKDARYHIGIAWKGSNLNQINPFRSIPLTCFLELCRVRGVQLYSLQVGEHAKDLHEQGCAASIRDLTGLIQDVSDTVSFLGHLDLVVSCESALPHICAAVGKECFVPYSWLGRDWRLGVAGDKMLWTPHHRVFLQNEGEAWEPVFDRIVRVLEARIDDLDRKAGTQAA
jgi:tetratricopeptide (TPR) repeat protein